MTAVDPVHYSLLLKLSLGSASTAASLWAASTSGREIGRSAGVEVAGRKINSSCPGRGVIAGGKLAGLNLAATGKSRIRGIGDDAVIQRLAPEFLWIG